MGNFERTKEGDDGNEPWIFFQKKHDTKQRAYPGFLRQQLIEQQRKTEANHWVIHGQRKPAGDG
jgi:hypothetical protein